MKTTKINPPNYGFIDVTLDDSHIDYLYSLIEKYEPEGSPQQWPLIDDDNRFQEEVLNKAVKEYIDEWGFPEKLKMTHVHGLTFQKFWVNKTGKGEYQALHNHDGVFSFVAWLNIPYASEVEQCVPNTMHPEAGDFILTYTDIVGRTRKMNWKIDKQHNEGHLLLFPSDCYHAVYPHFLTDEKRISVAGDILLNSLSCVDVHNQGGIPLGYGYSNSQEFL